MHAGEVTTTSTSNMTYNIDPTSSAQTKSTTFTERVMLVTEKSKYYCSRFFVLIL